MNVPVLQGGVTDLVALQSNVTLILLSDPRILCPVLPEIKFYMQSDQQIDALWMMPQSSFAVTPQGNWVFVPNVPGGLVGAGMLVEMPSMTVNSPAVTGSTATWDVNIVSFEERNTNFLSGTGTGITSEQYAQLAIDILQLQYCGPQFNTLQVKNGAINPAHDWMEIYPGIMAYRTSFTSTAGRQQTPRSVPVFTSIATGTCTLTCSDGAATLYYTTDGSMPCSANINTNQTFPNPTGIGATVYTGPFPVQSGQLVLAASQKQGLILSPVNGQIAP